MQTNVVFEDLHRFDSPKGSADRPSLLLNCCSVYLGRYLLKVRQSSLRDQEAHGGDQLVAGVCYPRSVTIRTFRPLADFANAQALLCPGNNYGVDFLEVVSSKLATILATWRSLRQPWPAVENEESGPDSCILAFALSTRSLMPSLKLAGYS